MVSFNTVRILIIFSSLSFSCLAVASEDLSGCAANLIEKLEFPAGRAEKMCSRARKIGANSLRYSNCVIGIHTGTNLAPEIISPYCLRRSDISYKECVVTTFKSKSNDNAFKSCLNKRISPVALRRQEMEDKLSIPATKLKISVGYVRDNYSLDSL